MQRRFYIPVFMMMMCMAIIFRRQTVYEKNNLREITINYTTSGSTVNVTTAKIRKPLRRIKIAFYYPYHGGLKNQMRKLKMSKCEYSNCDVRFTRPTSRIVDAHAVLFQGNNIPRVIPKRRNSNQVFIFIDVEAPQYLHIVNLASPKWRHFFNWTMTYRLDSDIPYPYGSIVLRPGFGNMTLSTKNTMDNRPTELSLKTINKALQNMPLVGRPGKNYKAIFKRKTKIAAWLVSHCITASRREKYVNLMKKHTRIDVFGKCTKRFCARGDECHLSIVQNYFYYLSFENSLCKDYVTEKEFNWFNEDIITVVRGARTYRNYLPFGTYIDSGDFKTPAHLAKFLNDLSKDEERYIAYLKRKDYFQTLEKGVVSQNAYCELCKRLNHIEKYRKSIKEIHTWWRKDACTQPFDLYGSASK